jgi:hypothetical protein
MAATQLVERERAGEAAATQEEQEEQEVEAQQEEEGQGQPGLQAVRGMCRCGWAACGCQDLYCDGLHCWYTTQFMGKRKKDEGPRSIITGKVIKMKVRKTREEKAAEKNRKDLLEFLNEAS